MFNLCGKGLQPVHVIAEQPSLDDSKCASFRIRQFALAGAQDLGIGTAGLTMGFRHIAQVFLQRARWVPIATRTVPDQG